MLATPVARDFMEMVYLEANEVDDFYAMRQVCRLWRDVSHRITFQWRRVFKKYRKNPLKTVPMYKQALQAAINYQLHRQTLVFHSLLKSKDDLEGRHIRMRRRIQDVSQDLADMDKAKHLYDHASTKRARIDLTEDF